MNGYRFDKLKLMVVDDNQHMRKLIITILQAFGATNIAEAADGARALEMLRDINPDVIFLDWAMEGMTGIELAQTIRKSPQAPNPFVPLIMLTGHTSVDHVRQARDAGINEFLAKPVSVKGILSRLVSVIEHPRPFVRTNSYFGPCRRRRASQEYRGPERRAATASTDAPKAALSR
jgi:CheY-like chemotaxis protein